VGEEHGTRPGRSERQWIIDPIDGTRFFTHNIPVCTNLLAYEDEHGAAIGVIGMPLQQEIVFAGRGLGCWLLRGLDSDASGARRVHVGDATVLGDAVVHGTHLHMWTDEFLMALHSRSLLIGNRGDDAYGIAMLATGRADAVVSVHTGKRWDWAPVPVIVAEAGGIASDLTGAALPGDGSSVAANAALHPQLLDAAASVRRIRPWRRLAEGGARAAANAPPK
jgi:histidinol-phosphatase